MSDDAVRDRDYWKFAAIQMSHLIAAATDDVLFRKASSRATRRISALRARRARLLLSGISDKSTPWEPELSTTVLSSAVKRLQVAEDEHATWEMANPAKRKA